MILIFHCEQLFNNKSLSLPFSIKVGSLFISPINFPFTNKAGIFVILNIFSRWYYISSSELTL